MINVGIIGAGGIVPFFIETTKMVKGFKYVGIAARNEEKLKAVKEKYGISYYSTDNDEVLSDPKIDVIYVAVPNSLNDLTPETSTYQKVIKIKSPLPFKTIEEISCYSMEYAVNDIIALSWVDIDNMEEFPPSRCVLHFKDKIEKVQEKLKELNIDLVF